MQASVYALATCLDAPTRSDRGTSYGVQIEGRDQLVAAHTLRAGLLASTEQLHRHGVGARDQRATIGLFVQDAWRIMPALTANLGVRADTLSRADGAAHVQPRASLVWTV